MLILSSMKKVAICQLNGRVAPRYDHSSEIVVFTVDDTCAIREKFVIPVGDMSAPDLTAFLGHLRVELVICGGVREDYQQMIKRHDFGFIDNIIGNIDDVIACYVAGTLERGQVIS